MVRARVAALEAGAPAERHGASPSPAPNGDGAVRDKVAALESSLAWLELGPPEGPPQRRKVRALRRHWPSAEQPAAGPPATGQPAADRPTTGQAPLTPPAAPPQSPSSSQAAPVPPPPFPSHGAVAAPAVEDTSLTASSCVFSATNSSSVVGLAPLPPGLFVFGAGLESGRAAGRTGQGTALPGGAAPGSTGAGGTALPGGAAPGSTGAEGTALPAGFDPEWKKKLEFPRPPRPERPLSRPRQPERQPARPARPDADPDPRGLGVWAPEPDPDPLGAWAPSQALSGMAEPRTAWPGVEADDPPEVWSLGDQRRPWHLARAVVAFHCACWQDAGQVPEEWSDGASSLAEVARLPEWLQASLQRRGKAGAWADEISEILQYPARLWRRRDEWWMTYRKAVNGMWQRLVTAINELEELDTAFWWALQITRRTSEAGLPFDIRPTWDPEEECFTSKLKWRLAGLEANNAYRRPTYPQQIAGRLKRPMQAVLGVAPVYHPRPRW